MHSTSLPTLKTADLFFFSCISLVNSLEFSLVKTEPIKNGILCPCLTDGSCTSENKVQTIIQSSEIIQIEERATQQHLLPLVNATIHSDHFWLMRFSMTKVQLHSKVAKDVAGLNGVALGIFITVRVVFCSLVILLLVQEWRGHIKCQL